MHRMTDRDHTGSVVDRVSDSETLWPVTWVLAGSVQTPMERRRYLAGLATACLTASVAGCIGSRTETPAAGNGGNGSTDGESGVEPTTADPTETDQTTDEGLSGGPEATVRTYLDAWESRDRAALAAAAHSESPLNPENHDADAELASAPFDGSETRLLETGVSRERVGEVRYVDATFDDETLSAVLDGHVTALVRVELSGGDVDGMAAETDLGVVTEDDQWRVLWRAPASTEESNLAIDAQVVDEVSFGDDSATVSVRDVPGFEQATIETESGETETIQSPESATVGVDPDFDTVIVTATVDGETEEVHRERTPPTDRFVEGIDFDPETEQARVRFDGETDVDAVRIDSVNTFSEASSETPEPLTYLTVGFDPAGDEIAVTLTSDGEEMVVYRERYSD